MLSPAEYERRRLFMEQMKSFSRAEFIEIARILRRQGITLSENRSGMYFDMASLSQEIFEELVTFHAFVQQNNRDLEKREVGTAS